MLTWFYRLPATIRYTRAELVEATDTDVEYYLFPGDVILRTDAAVFDAAWGRVPVLGFALRVSEACRKLQQGVPATVSFTETGDALRFEPSGDDVGISATFAADIIKVNQVELVSSARIFLRTVYSDLCARFEGLAENGDLASRVRGLLDEN